MRPRLLRGPALGAIVAFVLLGGALAPSPAPAAGGCSHKPDVFPVDQLKPGMIGTGYTVIQGRDPVPFDVEILGVLPDGVAPGIDLILVKVSGPVIDQTGGIAFGFSGSPVYIDGKLVGSVSYGFFAADQTIGGLTPAQPIVDLFDYPQGGPTITPASTVRLTPELRRAAARELGVPSGTFPESGKQLLLPLAVSGLNDRAMQKLQAALARAKMPFVPYTAGTVAAPQAVSSEPLRPGDSFADVLSYGDLTWAAIGTTTAVCDQLAVAFGHPFSLDGATTMGMNGANVVTVVRDPSHIFGPFKVATVAEAHGTVDQDRFAGVRGTQGVLPPLVPVRTQLTNPDLGRSRAGETDVAFQHYLPFLAAYHLLSNLDVVFDRVGDGTVGLSWSIRGLRESGRPFELARRNMYFSGFDASVASIFELLFEIAAIADNPFENVSFTGVDIEGSITQRHRTATITRVLSASSVDPRLRERKRIAVRPGDAIRLRVFLQLGKGKAERAVDLRVPVPRGASGGQLEVRGGQALRGCFYCILYGGSATSIKASSFDDLLAKLSGAEHNYDLVADLGSGRHGGSHAVVAPQPDVVVLGQETIAVSVVGGRPGKG